VKNLATVFSAELEGIQARTIEVEVDLNVGLHSFTIVGLADKALNEAKTTNPFSGKTENANLASKSSDEKSALNA